MTDDAVAWARAQLGSGARVTEQRRGEEADLWHVTGPGGDAWLKVHRHPAKAMRERAMLQRLAPHLHDVIPAVIAVREPDALLLSACPGEPIDLDALAPEVRAAVLAEAGAFLRRLTEIPLRRDEIDPIPLPEAYARRIASWLQRAAPTLSASRRDDLRRALDPSVFTGVARTPSHRDFQPRNWIFATSPPRLHVIDFGQARHDDWLVDLAKLDRTDVDAVLAGFGRALDPSEQARLHVLRALHDLATLTWAAK